MFVRFRHATDAVYDKYRCPVFKGFVVCVSGMASEDRNSVRSLVEQNGQCSLYTFTMTTAVAAVSSNRRPSIHVFIHIHDDDGCCSSRF